VRITAIPPPCVTAAWGRRGYTWCPPGRVPGEVGQALQAVHPVGTHVQHAQAGQPLQPLHPPRHPPSVSHRGRPARTQATGGHARGGPARRSDKRRGEGRSDRKPERGGASRRDLRPERQRGWSPLDVLLLWRRWGGRLTSRVVMPLWDRYSSSKVLHPCTATPPQSKAGGRGEQAADYGGFPSRRRFKTMMKRMLSTWILHREWPLDPIVPAAQRSRKGPCLGMEDPRSSHGQRALDSEPQGPIDCWYNRWNLATTPQDHPCPESLSPSVSRRQPCCHIDQVVALFRGGWARTWKPAMRVRRLLWRLRRSRRGSPVRSTSRILLRPSHSSRSRPSPPSPLITCSSHAHLSRHQARATSGMPPAEGSRGQTLPNLQVREGHYKGQKWSAGL
jgi:hypothetical protein